jgi:hypothetical protein
MIIIFEPQCRGFAHEQFNAGFLYGYSLAYQEEEIVFWGEKEHIKCIQAVFSSANLSFNKIEFNEIKIPQADFLRAFFEYSKLLKELLSYAYKNHCNKIVFLSIHTYNLIPLKYLLQIKYHNSIQIHVAMHGILEFIKRKNSSLLSELHQKVGRRFRKLFGIANIQLKYLPKNKYLYEKLFKISLQLFSNKNITYFVFREDSLKKIKEYFPKIHKQFKSIDLPYIYKDVSRKNEIISSNRIVFGTIGRSDIFAVQEVVRKLNNDSNNSINNFEIRIIGGNKIGHDNLEPIKYLGDGQILARSMIEEQIKDIQYILFFYDPDSYELTTSGAFFDAIAYSKPMIFLKNNCFDFYYYKYKFGYRCNNIDELISVIKRIILSDEKYYQGFVSEIIRMQRDTAISNNYYKLKFNEENNYE